jgi:hypothetical protein
MKNALDGVSIWVDIKKEKCEVGDITIETIQHEAQKTKGILRERWIKHPGTTEHIQTAK